MPKRKRRDDPIADYIEWTNNRYNPGYYLGGNIPPHLRKSTLGKRGRRSAGILLLISTFLSLGSFVALWPLMKDVSGIEIVLTVAFVALMGGAGVTMLRSSRRKPTDRNRRSDIQ